MKKTMFITSVIMVVVMAIALTTSSLAWFTAAGSSKVTTSSMTLTAKSTAAEGLLISQAETGDWSSNIDLITGNALSNMVPATPYTYDTGKTFIDAMVANKFIANTVDMNGNYSTDTPLKENVTTGTAEQIKYLYFADEFYITTVDTTNDLDVAPSIKWEKYDGTNSVWKTYTADSQVSGRIEPASSDPILYVAVLASKLTYTAADRNPSGKTWNATDAAVSSNWEILNVFASKGAGTVVNFGNVEETFQSTSSDDKTVQGSLIDNITIAGISTTANKTSTGLAKVTTHHSSGEALSTGEVRVFKVLAWYDGYTLQNSNSNFALRFNLEFNATTHTSSGSGS